MVIMNKKNIFIIFVVLLIPLIIIISYISNPSLYNSIEVNESKNITEKPDIIKNYELVLIEEINSYQYGEALQYALELYNVFPYTIVWKDTLSKIAYKFNLTKDEIVVLVYLNKIKNKNLIITGQVLLIPKKKK